MPSSRSFDLVYLGVVLFLDQIDVMSMHTVVRDIRDVVHAIRVSCAYQYLLFMHRNDHLRRRSRTSDERALYCVYLMQ
jgi:hypothetical protein